LCWKAAAFAHEVNEIYEQFPETEDSIMEGEEEDTSFPSVASTDVSSCEEYGMREIISLGDSMEERTAVRIVAEQLQAQPKSVMFLSLPTPLQILGQLHMLHQHMKFVCTHPHSLDLEISPEQASRCAETYLRKHELVSSPQDMNQWKGWMRRSASTEEGIDVVVASSG
jgi:hypothetical protein